MCFGTIRNILWESKVKKKASFRLSKSLGYHSKDFELGEQQGNNRHVLKNYTGNEKNGIK